VDTVLRNIPATIPLPLHVKHIIRGNLILAMAESKHIFQTFKNTFLANFSQNFYVDLEKNERKITIQVGLRETRIFKRSQL
jgi:hypothetical protein